jgi:hypothetical protein
MEELTWLTVVEAAHATGKSERTIRRWMAGGKVTRSGALVGLPATSAIPDMTATGEVAEVPDTPDMAQLRAELDKVTALLTEVTGERDYLRQAHAAALTRIPQLPEKAESLTPRPWWRRVLGLS